MDKVLIVTPDGTERTAILAQLGAPQFDSASAEDTATALLRMDAIAPDLLVTVVRGDVFNGLPLVTEGCMRNPRMAALVLHDTAKAALDCAAIPVPGAVIRHVDRATGATELVKLAAEAIALRERRKWSRTLLHSPLTVNLLIGRARVLNVSYGGVQIELASPLLASLPDLFNLELPNLGPLNALRVWSRTSESGSTVSCGAEVSPASVNRVLRWRRMVDALRKAGNSLLV